MIMSRTKEKLEQVAKTISKEMPFFSFNCQLNWFKRADLEYKDKYFFSGDTTGRQVKVVVTDFVKEDVFGDIEEQLRELDIGILGRMNTKRNI